MNVDLNATSNKLHITLAHLHDTRSYGYKAERAAALIYAHFKKEFGLPIKHSNN